MLKFNKAKIFGTWPLWPSWLRLCTLLDGFGRESTNL